MNDPGLQIGDDTNETDRADDPDGLTSRTDPDDIAVIEAERPTKSGIARFVREWGIVLVVALTVAVVVRAFIFSPFYIPSSSMEPGLQINDRILVNKLSYKVHDVHRQDVVVFDAPPGVDFGPNVKDLVKRVIGLPGDTVQLSECTVLINGTPLSEPYVKNPNPGACGPTAFSAASAPDVDGKVHVPAGYVLVLGDNRGNSDDGRTWGFLDENLIVGRAFVIYWPFSHWTWL